MSGKSGLVRDYFKGSKLLNESGQICFSGSSFTAWNISGAI